MSIFKYSFPGEPQIIPGHGRDRTSRIVSNSLVIDLTKVPLGYEISKLSTYETPHDKLIYTLVGGLLLRALIQLPSHPSESSLRIVQSADAIFLLTTGVNNQGLVSGIGRFLQPEFNPTSLGITYLLGED